MKRLYDVIIGDKYPCEPLYMLKEFPLNMLMPADTDKKDDMLYDMQFGISQKTGVIQLLDTPNPDLIYTDAHFNAVGELWQQQHEKLSEFIRNATPPPIKCVRNWRCYGNIGKNISRNFPQQNY